MARKNTTTPEQTTPEQTTPEQTTPEQTTASATTQTAPKAEPKPGTKLVGADTYFTRQNLPTKASTITANLKQTLKGCTTKEETTKAGMNAELEIHELIKKCEFIEAEEQDKYLTYCNIITKAIAERDKEIDYAEQVRKAEEERKRKEEEERKRKEEEDHAGEGNPNTDIEKYILTIPYSENTSLEYKIQNLINVNLERKNGTTTLKAVYPTSKDFPKYFWTPFKREADKLNEAMVDYYEEYTHYVSRMMQAEKDSRLATFERDTASEKVELYEACEGFRERIQRMYEGLKELMPKSTYNTPKIKTSDINLGFCRLIFKKDSNSNQIISSGDGMLLIRTIVMDIYEIMNKKERTLQKVKKSERTEKAAEKARQAEKDEERKAAEKARKAAEKATKAAEKRRKAEIAADHKADNEAGQKAGQTASKPGTEAA